MQGSVPTSVFQGVWDGCQEGLWKEYIPRRHLEPEGIYICLFEVGMCLANLLMFRSPTWKTLGESSLIIYACHVSYNILC